MTRFDFSNVNAEEIIQKAKEADEAYAKYWQSMTNCLNEESFEIVKGLDEICNYYDNYFKQLTYHMYRGMSYADCDLLAKQLIESKAIYRLGKRVWPDELC
jgi:hypothetical protein